MRRSLSIALLLTALAASAARAQSARIIGTVRDDSGEPLPGASIALRTGRLAIQEIVTDSTGGFRFEQLPAGQYELTCRLINFATTRRQVAVAMTGTSRADVVLHFALNADVTVTAKRTFTNLADVQNPAEDLVGIAQAASQGAITAKQLDERTHTVKATRI